MHHCGTLNNEGVVFELYTNRWHCIKHTSIVVLATVSYVRQTISPRDGPRFSGRGSSSDTIVLLFRRRKDVRPRCSIILRSARRVDREKNRIQRICTFNRRGAWKITPDRFYETVSFSHIHPCPVRVQFFIRRPKGLSRRDNENVFSRAEQVVTTVAVRLKARPTPSSLLTRRGRYVCEGIEKEKNRVLTLAQTRTH